MQYIASVSYGKDSLAMLLMLLEKGMPLDEVIFYDTTMEFDCIYKIRDQATKLLDQQHIRYTELKFQYDFLFYMLEKPVCKRGTHTIHQYGYGWCGGPCRWGTSVKLSQLNRYCKDAMVYVGIAADEVKRLKNKAPNKLFPLVDWHMTEADCLHYCHQNGFHWMEDGVALYSILDRVSCWCCRNKNLKELKNIYQYLPRYWKKLCELQACIPEAMKGEGKSVFELEQRFREELKLVVA